ncbi:MAG: DNA-directed RNA polymerase subunit beta, partial [Planctomycetota bacterium]
VPDCDMPFLADGTAVDIVLNPLGVPSRMNVGQILETHLGWAAKLLGFYAKTPVFEGANEREIGLLMKLAGLRWARETLLLGDASIDTTPAEVKVLLADIKPDRRLPDKVELLGDANLNDLGGKGMSPETKALYGRVREFVSTAAKTLAAREIDAVQAAIAIHRHDAGELPGDAADAIAVLETQAAMTPSATLQRIGQPALAAIVGAAKDADVDAAATELIRLAGLTPTGKVRLRDGRTGEMFNSPVTVGEIYMLKLSHLVDDKIHARSIGPYSLVTQQPLAGKAQFGGQRFGEMEVWALEAYGAANILQELLTVKSDDVDGRTKIYEAMVKNENILEPGTPVSFGVLCNEIKGLGLNIELHKRGAAETVLPG